MLKRLLGHIALWVCCLFGALSLSGAEVPQRLPHDSGSPRTAAELVCSLDTQGAAMRQFIHDSLRSDNLPAAQGVNGSRVLTPVFRLDPRLDLLTGAMPAMLRNTPAPMLQYRVQEQFCTLFRSSLDASGYYIFALRKIIV